MFLSNTIEYKHFKIDQTEAHKFYVTLPERLPGLGPSVRVFKELEDAINFIDTYLERTQCPDISE